MLVLLHTLLCAGLQLCLWTVPAGALVEVNTKDKVEVLLGETAEIPCQYRAPGEQQPLTLEWIMKDSSGNRHLLYYSHGSTEVLQAYGSLTGRVNVSRTHSSMRLVLRDVHIQDGQEEFICQVSGNSSGSQKGHTRLRVYAIPELPVIKDENSAASVLSEAPTKIATCEVKNGYPTPKITWYRGLNPLHPSPSVKIMPRVTQEPSGLNTIESDLLLLVSEEDKDAEFYCEVTYSTPGITKMTESKHFNITVYYPSTEVKVFIEEPRNQLVTEGDTVKIRCLGNGNPQPSPFSFFKKGDENELVSETSLAEDGSGVLTLEHVSRAHSGVYICNTTDYEVFTELSGTVELKVHYLDEVVVTPRGTDVIAEGTNLDISCNALSSLPTNILWFKDKKNVGKGNVLRLKNATSKSDGEYRCEVSVPSNPELHKNGFVEIRVLVPPQIQEPGNVSLSVSNDSFVNLTCIAHGFPAPNITWNVNGAEEWQEVLAGATDRRAQSAVEIRVTSDVMVFCIATSSQGQDSKHFIVKAISIATITSSTTTRASLTAKPPRRIQNGEGSGVIIAVLIICILLLAILGSVLYFLYKKGRLPCGRSGRKDMTMEKGSKDNIITEMKREKTEETVLLQSVNGEKKLADEK